MKKKMMIQYSEVLLPLQPQGKFREKNSFLYEGFYGSTNIDEAEKNSRVQYRSGRGRKEGSGAVSHSQIKAHVNNLVKHNKISRLKAFEETEKRTGFEADYIRNVYYKKQASRLLEDPPSESDFIETQDYDTFKKSLLTQMQTDKGFYDAGIIFSYTREHYGDDQAKEIMELFIKQARCLLREKPDWILLNDSIKKAKQLVALEN
jgi:hypothetical protein